MIEFVFFCAVGFLGIGLITLFVYLSMRNERNLFNQRFPPISDAEFLARCRPGTNPEVALKVRRIVAYSLGVDYERIYPSTRFVEDVGAD